MSQRYKSTAFVLMCVSQLVLSAPVQALGRAALHSTPAATAKGRKRPSRRAPVSSQVCTEPSIPTDLTGSKYEGSLLFPDRGITELTQATLEIRDVPQETDKLKKQEFSLTIGGRELRGRLTAETTCKYTGVTMMFDADGQSPPLIISLRACRKSWGKGHNRSEPLLTLSNNRVDTRRFEFANASGFSPMAPPDWGHGKGGH
jgi:hypothetical protein